jgi:hypothetical protein
MRKRFGKDLTPVKLQMRKPGIVWGTIGMETGLGRTPKQFRTQGKRHHE